MKKPLKFDYDKPIKILSMKRNGFDIFFYTSLLTGLVVGVIALICVHDGKFVIQFDLWRVLVCIPMVILITFLKDLLDQLKIYPKKLSLKHIWTIDELMEMTKKDRKTTESIMNNVLDSCFIVDDHCIKKM